MPQFYISTRLSKSPKYLKYVKVVISVYEIFQHIFQVYVLLFGSNDTEALLTGVGRASPFRATSVRGGKFGSGISPKKYVYSFEIVVI